MYLSPNTLPPGSTVVTNVLTSRYFFFHPGTITQVLNFPLHQPGSKTVNPELENNSYLKLRI